jgi:hypothetical protein
MKKIHDVDIWTTFKEEFLPEMLRLIEILRSTIQKENILTYNNKYFVSHYIIVFPFHAVTHFAFVRGNFSLFSLCIFERSDNFPIKTRFTLKGLRDYTSEQ